MENTRKQKRFFSAFYFQLFFKQYIFYSELSEDGWEFLTTNAFGSTVIESN
jgi:hypothetical protein